MNKKIIRYIIISLISILWLYLSLVYLLPLSLNPLPDSTIIHDANDIEIWEIISDNKVRHRQISYDEIPEFYKTSIIQIEDKSFYDNNWIDLRWLLRSVINNIKARKIVEWWSTISSQYIRNNLWLNEDRWISKKILEFIYAIRLNGKYSKNEILEKDQHRYIFSEKSQKILQNQNR